MAVSAVDRRQGRMREELDSKSRAASSDVSSWRARLAAPASLLAAIAVSLAGAACDPRGSGRDDIPAPPPAPHAAEGVAELDLGARAGEEEAEPPPPPTAAAEREGDPAHPGPETAAERVGIKALGDGAAYDAATEARLLEALRHRDQDVRGLAAWALGRHAPASRAGIPALIEALADPVWAVSHNAVWSLVRFPADLVEPGLVAALADASPARRVRAAGALLDMGSPPSREPAVEGALVSGFDAADDALRVVAVVTMGRVEAASQEVVRRLVEALSAEDHLLRGAAAASLAEVGPRARAAVPALIAAAGDGDTNVRSAAFTALGRIGEGSPEVLALLRETLDQPGDRVGDAATMALSALGALDVLGETLEGGSGRAKRRAVAGIGAAETLEPPRVELLLRALEDPDWLVRLGAAGAFAGHAMPEAVPALARALADPHEAVSGQARATLHLMDLAEARSALAAAPAAPPAEGADR